MTDEDLMPFGMYEGQKMANVPPDYLMWIHKTVKPSTLTYRRVLKYIDDNMESIEKELEKFNQNDK